MSLTEDVAEDSSAAVPNPKDRRRRIILIVAQLAPLLCAYLTTAWISTKTDCIISAVAALVGMMLGAIGALILSFRTTGERDQGMGRVLKIMLFTAYLLAFGGLASGVAYVPRYGLAGGSKVVVEHGRTNLHGGFFTNALSRDYRHYSDIDECIDRPSVVAPGGEGVTVERLCARFRPVADEERLVRYAARDGSGKEQLREAAKKRLAAIFANAVRDARPLRLGCSGGYCLKDEGLDAMTVDPTEAERDFTTEYLPIAIVGRLWLKGPSGVWKVRYAPAE